MTWTFWLPGFAAHVRTHICKYQMRRRLELAAHYMNLQSVAHICIFHCIGMNWSKLLGTRSPAWIRKVLYITFRHLILSTKSSTNVSLHFCLQCEFALNISLFRCKTVFVSSWNLHLSLLGNAGNKETMQTLFCMHVNFLKDSQSDDKWMAPGWNLPNVIHLHLSLLSNAGKQETM